MLWKPTALPECGEPPENYDSWTVIIILLKVHKNWLSKWSRQQVMITVNVGGACESNWRYSDIRGWMTRIKLHSPHE